MLPTLNATRAVLSGMVERRRGAIVSIASDAGFGELRMADYGPMKAGVMAFTRIIAKEYGRYGIRANTVCPGLVIPEPDAIGAGSLWQADIGFGEKQITDMEKATPLRRRPEAVDIAKTVAWLASEPAGMLTGQVVSVSGGFNMPALMSRSRQPFSKLHSKWGRQCVEVSGMRHERQVELLRRLHGVDAPRPGPLAAASMHNPATAYTTTERFDAEMRTLFGRQPVLVGLSGEVREPGSYVTLTAGGIPLAIVRQADGTVRGFVNVCRHRGSTLLGSPCGVGLRSIRCPYHAWTYGLGGELQRFPGAEPGFDDIDKATHGLIEVPVAEGSGLVFAIADSTAGAFTVEDALHGADEEIADFGIADYDLVDTREREWAMNWKLVMDTFSEPYHIPWLHKDSIAPYYLFDRWIHDSYGPHQRFIGCRTSVLEELAKPDEDDWELLPHGTLQYLLVPNAVLVHQMDHLELWRLQPIAPDRTLVRTSVFSPPDAPRQPGYYVKNLDILLGVTDTEDFPMQEQVQRNLASGAMPELVYGKMEPALVAYHAAVNELLASG